MTRFEQVMADLASGKQKALFPNKLPSSQDGLIGIGGSLSVPMIIEAYTKGIFPWTGAPPIPWFSPNPRLVLYPEQFNASHTLRRLERQKKLRLVFDLNFQAVIERCSSISRKDQDGTWITSNVIQTYSELYKHGIAHSVEVYNGDKLCGGLYGLTFGRVFHGESMFSDQPNASKIALYGLCQKLVEKQFHFIDCQQETPHLESLGAVAIPRDKFIQELQQAVESPSLHHSWNDWGESS